MMDYIAGLVQRGLISPDALDGLVQQVNDVRNRNPQVGNIPLEAGGGGGQGLGGASGRATIAPDYGLSTYKSVPDEAVVERMPNLGKIQLDQLHDDFKAGLNNQQIADKYGVTKQAIQQRRSQLGYEPLPRGRPWPSRSE